MRTILIVLLLVLVAACGDNSSPSPDALPDDGFGLPCTPGTEAPLTTCETPSGLVGWCLASTCRRACVKNTCPAGQTPTPILGGADCYCRP